MRRPRGIARRRESCRAHRHVREPRARAIACDSAEPYMAESRFADAERELRAGLEQEPDNVDANVMLSHCSTPRAPLGSIRRTWPDCCGWDGSRSRI